MKYNITRETIFFHTKNRWDAKNSDDKIKSGKKYKHVIPSTEWSLPFNKLTKEQQIILLKGELIRTYDNLPNIIKTKIKKNLNLSVFSSKWYKLPSDDKIILLKEYVI